MTSATKLGLLISLTMFSWIVVDTCAQSLQRNPELSIPSGPGHQPGSENPPPDDSVPFTLRGVYTVDGENGILESDGTYTSETEDVSAVFVTNGGELTLKNSTVFTSGNTSSQSNSSFYGLNAAVLATKAGTLIMEGGRITTTGTGANGAIATDPGSSIILSNVDITAENDGGHGVMATNGGSITLTNVNMKTSGPHSAPIATDRGGGTINVYGGSVMASGEGSPGIYSTGVITATNLNSRATGSEALVIEGKNEVTLNNSFLYGEKLCGVMIYQSFSGDAEMGTANFTMTGGALRAGSGPLIFVTNTTANITLKDASAVASSGQLLKTSTGRWGREGKNGGILTFTADRQILTGTIVVDQESTLALRLLNGSAFKGSINADHTGKEVSVSLDATSTWNVTGDSYISCMIFPEGSSEKYIGNIIGNGHTVFYDSSKCPELNGRSYELPNGGELKPVV